MILNIKIKIVKEQYKEYNFIRSIDKVDYRYDRKFEGNSLIVRRTSCSKTTFVQNLDKNKLFGDVKEVYWISQIELSKDREKNIRDCFVDQTINFDYPNNVEEFNDLLEVYTRKKSQLYWKWLRRKYDFRQGYCHRRRLWPCWWIGPVC